MNKIQKIIASGALLGASAAGVGCGSGPDPEAQRQRDAISVLNEKFGVTDPKEGWVNASDKGDTSQGVKFYTGDQKMNNMIDATAKCSDQVRAAFGGDEIKIVTGVETDAGGSFPKLTISAANLKNGNLSAVDGVKARAILEQGSGACR